MPTPKLVIIIEGASIMSIVSHDPAFAGMEVHVIDYDARESPAEADTHIVQSDGASAPAFYTSHIVQPCEVFIPEDAEPRR